MARIRSKYKLRVFFLLLVLSIAVLSYQLVREEENREWKKYQDKFRDVYAAALTATLAEAPGEEGAGQTETWRRTLAELAASKTEMKQTFLPGANVRDLCTTCHLGIDNALLQDAPEPFRTHPGNLLKQHKPGRFGCTLCHHGLGVGTSVEAAHGLEENWSQPLLPAAYVQSTCAGCHDTPFMLEGAEKLERGRRAFASRGCYGCHAAPGFEGLPKVAAPLDNIGTKLSNSSWLYNWLKGPSTLRTQTRMPDFKLADEDAGDVMAFLLSLRSGDPLQAYPLQAASEDNGKKLFVERGCRGCHSIAKDEPGASPRVPNLSSIGLKVTPDWIMAWLEDPRAYNPDARMPKTVLTDAERRDITVYLMTLKANAEIVKPDEELDLAAFDLENGKKLVELYGCYGCHAIEGFEKLPAPGVAVSEVTHKELDELPFGNTDVPRTKWDWIRNKISTPRIYQTEDMPLRMPEAGCDEDEVEALTTFYLHNARRDLPESFLQPASLRIQALQKGDWLIGTYNCQGCHMLEEGKNAVIADQLALKSMVPPRLVGEGEKVQPQWLFEFLNKPTALRPWLKIRMPDFGFSHDDAETLVNYFAELAAGSGIAFPYILLPRREDMPEEEVQMGEYRVRTDKCVQCHPITLDAELPEDVALEDLSINLMMAKTRLRFEWIKSFLRNPDQYAGAGTKMPFVFYDPDGNPKVPDPEMWIDLTAKYLMVMEKPPEVIEETLEEIRPGSEVDWTSYD